MSQPHNLMQSLININPILKLCCHILRKMPILSQLSTHFSQIFLKGMSENNKKFLFLFGMAGLSYYSMQKIKQFITYSQIFISHKVSQTKLNESFIKSKYGDTWVVITGFTQGIGWAFVQQLLKLNLKLILVGRNRQKMLKKIQIIKQKYPQSQLKMIVGDLSKLSDIQNICVQLKKLSQSIDIGIIINNAGANAAGQYLQSKPNQILSISQTNLRSVIQLNNCMIPVLKKRAKRSAIINISSCTGRFISHYLLTYPSSKRMLNIYSAYLAKENSSKIDILTAMPFGVITPMMKMKKMFFMITPEDCAKSVLADSFAGKTTTYGGMKHKFIANIFQQLTQEECAMRLQKTWKMFF